MYRAKAREKGSVEDYKSVSWGGLVYYSNKEQLEEIVSEMMRYFPQNDYIIEEYFE